MKLLLPILGAVLSLLVPTKNIDTCTRHPRRSPMFKMSRRKRRRVPLLPMVRGTEYVRLKGQQHCPAMHSRIRHWTTICPVHESRCGETIHTPTGLRQPTTRTFLAIQSSGRPRAHGNGPTQRRSNLPMLARLLFREETYSGRRQGLRSSRYIRTVKRLNDGRGVYPTIRTCLLEDELRFQARHGLRTRPGGNTRLEQCTEDGQPGQKRFSHAIHTWPS